MNNNNNSNKNKEILNGLRFLPESLFAVIPIPLTNKKKKEALMLALDGKPDTFLSYIHNLDLEKLKNFKFDSKINEEFTKIDNFFNNNPKLYEKPIITKENGEKEVLNFSIKTLIIGSLQEIQQAKGDKEAELRAFNSFVNILSTVFNVYIKQSPFSKLLNFFG